MRRETSRDRAARPAQRSNSQRRQPSVPRNVIPEAVAGCASRHSPASDSVGDPPRSAGSAGSGRPPTDPGRVYGVSQTAEASGAGAGRRSSRGHTPSGGIPVGVSPNVGTRPAVARSSSTGSARAAAAGAARVISGSAGGDKPIAQGENSAPREALRRDTGGTGDVIRTAVFGYLKVYGLNQYARAFIEAGLGELEAIGRLSETEALEFLERLRVYPGHRLRLLRAIDCLRHGHLGAERRDAAQMLEDDAALERLCAQNEELSKEKHHAEGENRRLQEDNSRMIGVIRQQDAQLQKARDRVAELEELVQSQTEQVNFLAQQLQMLAEADPKKECELYRSYRDSFVDDWGEAQKIELPSEVTALPAGEDAGVANGDATRKALEDLSKPRCFTPEDFTPKMNPPQMPMSAGAPSQAALDLGRSQRGSRLSAGSGMVRGSRQGAFEPPGRSRLAKSLDSAQVRECLAGFDVDHIIRCLATAIQNKIIVSLGKSRPHQAPPERTSACAIFLEPACRERLEEAASDPLGNNTVELTGFGTASGSTTDLKGSLGKQLDPLNSVAVRSVPHRWDIYGFLRDVMMNFRMEPEVSIITLFYLDRFSELSGVAMTPDNWQRLTIAAMMLASKVWNDESFENIEFAQLCPLYTLDEINTFERIFLKCIGYNCSVKGSQYAKTYFLLRTLGAKDSADFGLEPMEPQRASRLLERCLEKQVEFKERYPMEREADLMNWTM